MAADSLQEKIDALDSKAEEYERLENIDAKVNEADRELTELNRDLVKLHSELDGLTHFVTVLSRVFDEDQPASVDDAHARARKVIVNQESDIVAALVATDDSLKDTRDRISKAKSQVSNAHDQVDDTLDSIEEEWMSKIDAARGVLRIVGGDRELEDAMNNMEQFLKTRMWDDSKEINALQSNWNSYIAVWEREGIDWEELKSEYGVEDETVSCLKTLSRGNEVNLADLSDPVIDDLHRVKEIGAEIKLSL